MSLKNKLIGTFFTKNLKRRYFIKQKQQNKILQQSNYQKKIFQNKKYLTFLNKKPIITSKTNNKNKQL